MRHKEYLQAFIDGKKVEVYGVRREKWYLVSKNNSLFIFDSPDYRFRIVEEPIRVEIECVCASMGGSKYLLRGEGLVVGCHSLGIKPEIGTKFKMILEEVR